MSAHALTPLRPILLVEDNLEDIELAMAVLGKSHLGNPIVVARHGAEALDYLHHRGNFQNPATQRPIVVVLDLKMPMVDGLEVLRQIKSDPALRTIPVVMFTSSREAGDLIRSYELGANAYVVKPVDFHQYSDVIRHLGIFWGVLNELPPA
jgi:CheY-like chemotaxis protein